VASHDQALETVTVHRPLSVARRGWAREATTGEPVSEIGHCPRHPEALLLRAMRTLLDDLHASLQEDRRCGELDSGVEGERVWMTCDCGAGLSRSLLRADKLPANRVEESQ
jgi:hypothetical protein